MFKGQIISDKKLYRIIVKIPFSRVEAKLMRRAVGPWEGYLDENFRKGKRTAEGVIALFAGWELCELVAAVDMEVRISGDPEYVKSLRSILDQKILPAKRIWLKR